MCRGTWVARGLAEVSTADCKPVQSWPRAGESEPKRHATSVVAVAPQSQPGWDLRSHTYMSGSAVRDGIIPCPPARGDLPSVSWTETEENMQLRSGKQSKQTGVFLCRGGARRGIEFCPLSCRERMPSGEA